MWVACYIRRRWPPVPPPDLLNRGDLPVFDLAVCAEMVFRDRPFEERVRRIHDLGFQVEIWNSTVHDVDVLARTGARFSSMTGYVHGRLSDEDGATELLRTAEELLPVAEKLDCPRLNLHGTELGEGGLPVRPEHEVTGAMWLTACRTLSRIAKLGERAGVTFCLENLNTAVDHPGVPFARAADTLALVEAVDSPGLRMMLDLYHAQIGEGNLIELLRRAGSLIGEVQVADVPGRCEPGTGEINYPAIAAALADMGYRGTVGLEGFASGDSELALQRFRDAFSRPAPGTSAAAHLLLEGQTS
ncbi:TIM barrel protein [Saccharopolyspora erythraea]|nr:TIM barrel protein [Saccharopolyspora erythraea]